MYVARILAKFAKSLNTDATHKGAHETGDLKWSARPTASAGWLLCDGAAISRTTYAALFAAIGTAYGAGDGSTTFNVPDYRGRAPVGAGTGTFADTVANTAVTIAADTITVPSNVEKWLTGTAVVLTTTGAAPTGLTAGSTYYVIRVDATTIKLASTLALAIAGTGIDITGQGTGSHTLTASLTARARGDRMGEEKHATTAAEMPSHNHNAGAVITGRNTSTGGGEAIVYQGSTNLSTATGGSGAHNNMQPSTVSNVFIYAAA